MITPRERALLTWSGGDVRGSVNGFSCGKVQSMDGS